MRKNWTMRRPLTKKKYKLSLLNIVQKQFFILHQSSAKKRERKWEEDEIWWRYNTRVSMEKIKRWEMKSLPRSGDASDEYELRFILQIMTFYVFISI